METLANLKPDLLITIKVYLHPEKPDESIIDIDLKGYSQPGLDADLLARDLTQRTANHLGFGGRVAQFDLTHAPQES